jgi:L-ribulose-5-phosphate 3-epimerase
VKIGIVQGRLSPPPSDRIQAFPWSSWEDEFARAQSLGFDTIEWLLEDVDRNPLMLEAGRRRIRELSALHGVAVTSVCADHFIAHPFFRVSDAEARQSVELLCRLIDAASDIGAGVILVPVLEEAEIRGEREADALVTAVRACLPQALARAVRLGIETELQAADYASLLARIGDNAVGAYYDTGNAAARGYDCAADIRMLGASIHGVHLKDRLRGGGTVALGEGAVDFPATLQALAYIGYDGTLVVQGAVGPDYLELAARYRRFVKNAVGAPTMHPA